MNVDRPWAIDRLPEELALQCVLRTSEAACFCGVSVSHFRRLHSHGVLPAPIRLGERRLGWRLGDLIAWLRSRQCN
ncbi:MAG: AlpA family phage regulatory protein [Rhizobiales bacterium]|nr:AlpA family phage regulatory protein [Hyphomicrobiales bacterium]